MASVKLASHSAMDRFQAVFCPIRDCQVSLPVPRFYFGGRGLLVCAVTAVATALDS